LTDEFALADWDKFQDPRDGLKNEIRRAKTTLSDAFLNEWRFNVNKVPPQEDFVKE
jgi:hypothetical protein